MTLRGYEIDCGARLDPVSPRDINLCDDLKILKIHCSHTAIAVMTGGLLGETSGSDVLGAGWKSPPAVMARNRMSPRALVDEHRRGQQIR
jgi:hypothetical protein